jgi:hypothetical protein
MAATTNQRGNAKDSCGSVEEDVGRNEEHSKLSLVTSSAALIDSHLDQDVIQEDAFLHSFIHVCDPS